MTDINKLAIFVDLASHLHFARTAEKHHMSPSTLSRVVQRLESEAGVSLLYRDNRNVRLTDAGEKFVAFARETLLRWHAFESDTGQFQGQLKGRVSLYCSVTASHSLLTDMLSNLRLHQPDIEIKLHTGDQALSLRRVLEGSEDLAIAAKPDKLDPKIAFKPLLLSGLVFIAPKNDCSVKTQIENMRSNKSFDWGALPWVVAESGLARSRLDQWLSSRGIKPDIYAQVSGHEAIVSMVGLGCGIGLVPKVVITNSPAFDNIEILENEAGLASSTVADFEIGLCVLKRRLNESLIHAVWSSVIEDVSHSNDK